MLVDITVSIMVLSLCQNTQDKKMKKYSYHLTLLLWAHDKYLLSGEGTLEQSFFTKVDMKKEKKRRRGREEREGEREGRGQGWEGTRGRDDGAGEGRGKRRREKAEGGEGEGGWGGRRAEGAGLNSPFRSKLVMTHIPPLLIVPSAK